MGALGAGLGCGLDTMRESADHHRRAGLVQVHFLIDAKVWRLREPQQRAIMNRRFNFLLGT